MNLDIIQWDKAKQNYYYCICSKVRTTEFRAVAFTTFRFSKMVVVPGHQQPKYNYRWLVGWCHSGIMLHSALYSHYLINPRFVKSLSTSTGRSWNNFPWISLMISENWFNLWLGAITIRQQAMTWINSGHNPWLWCHLRSLAKCTI